MCVTRIIHCSVSEIDVHDASKSAAGDFKDLHTTCIDCRGAKNNWSWDLLLRHHKVRGVATIGDVALMILHVVGLDGLGTELLLVSVATAVTAFLLTAIYHAAHTSTVPNLEVLDC